MTEPLFAAAFISEADRFVAAPAHALLLTGPAGAGKGTALRHLAAKLLNTADVVEHPAVLSVATDQPAISIDDIRAIQHFLALKTTGGGDIRRIVLIEDAPRMSAAAQNALLKTIEEPPADTVLLLSAAGARQLLPTIVSRVQELPLALPSSAEVNSYFVKRGSTAEAIERAIALSGGLPGLTAALVDGDGNHPMLQAVDWCRQLLSAGRFERLTMVDELSKQRELAIQICDVLGRMATVALKKPGQTTAQLQRWQAVLGSSLQTADHLRAYANAKLALCSLCLHI